MHFLPLLGTTNNPSSHENADIWLRLPRTTSSHVRKASVFHDIYLLNYYKIDRKKTPADLFIWFFFQFFRSVWEGVNFLHSSLCSAVFKIYDKMVLIINQCFIHCWTVCTGPRVSASYYVLPSSLASLLWVGWGGKKLGGDTAVKTDPIWPKA